MSFILRCNEKKAGKKRNTALGVRAHRSLKATTTTTSSKIAYPRSSLSGGSHLHNVSTRTPARSGSGQTQLMRPALVTQQKQPLQQQDPHQRNDISMDQIYEDLRILDEQQKESQRKLENARQLKQRGLEQIATVECKLEDLKYLNGQRRAELQRHREILSQGHRKLAEIQSAAGAGDDDLRKFHRNLKKVLVTKRRLQAHGRKQERLYDKLTKNIALVTRLSVEKQQHIDQLKRVCEETKQREESLRHTIHARAIEEQKFAQEVDKIRKDSEGIEHSDDQQKQDELSVAQSLSKSKEQAAIDGKRLRENLTVLEDKIGATEKSKHETSAKLNGIQEVMSNKRDELHRLWHRLIEIQLEEGHMPSKPPSESSTPPLFDRDRLQTSLQAETTAAEDEKVAKNKLTSSVESLRLEVEKIEKDLAESKAKSIDIKHQVEAARKAEAKRAQESRKLIEELELTNKETTDLRAKTTHIRIKQDKENDKLIEQCKNVEFENDRLRNQVTEAKQLLCKEDSSATAILARCEQENSKLRINLAEANKRVTAARRTYHEVEEEAVRLINENSSTLERVKKDEHKQLLFAEEVKKEIAKMCNVHPVLENIKYVYDPEITKSEQIAKHLQPIVLLYQDRLERAQNIHYERGEALECKEGMIAERTAKEKANLIDDCLVGERSKKKEARYTDNNKIAARKSSKAYKDDKHQGRKSRHRLKIATKEGHSDDRSMSAKNLDKSKRREESSRGRRKKTLVLGSGIDKEKEKTGELTKDKQNRLKRTEGGRKKERLAAKKNGDIDEETSRRREKRKRRKEKEKQCRDEIALAHTKATEPESEAKPRDLMSYLAKASFDDVDEPLTDDDFLPKASTQEKKVHWREDLVGRPSSKKATVGSVHDRKESDKNSGQRHRTTHSVPTHKTSVTQKKVKHMVQGVEDISNSKARNRLLNPSLEVEVDKNIASCNVGSNLVALKQQTHFSGDGKGADSSKTQTPSFCQPSRSVGGGEAQSNNLRTLSKAKLKASSEKTEGNHDKRQKVESKGTKSKERRRRKSGLTGSDRDKNKLHKSDRSIQPTAGNKRPSKVCKESTKGKRQRRPETMAQSSGISSQEKRAPKTSRRRSNKTGQSATLSKTKVRKAQSFEDFSFL